MHCARAVQKEIIESYRDADLSVYVVWLPMIPSDSEEAARRSATMYGDPRLRQFYDPDRLSGTAFAREAADGVRQALASLPPDHPLRPRFEEWLRLRPEEKPMWDIVYFFPKEAVWTDELPETARWSKQIAFYDAGEAGRHTGQFFRNDPNQPPVESDWFLELRTAMKELQGAPAMQDEIPIACRLDALSPADRAREAELLREHLAAVLETRELADGYSFRFSSDPARFARMAELVALEHRCCPFLNFRLDWAGAEESPWLHVTGSPKAKEFVAETFARKPSN